MYRQLLFFFFSFFLFNNCFAFQDTLQYQLRHYTDENGLPQNSVKFIAPDEHGFIWLSTEDGLARFDGSNFVRFGKENMNVTSNRFQALYRGVDGTGLYSYNDKDEQVRIENLSAKRDSLSPSWNQRRSRYIADSTRVPHSKYANGSITIHRKRNAGIHKIIIPSNDGNAYVYNGETITFYQQEKLVSYVPFHTKDDWKFFLVNDRLYFLQANGHVTTFFPNRSSNVILSGDILKDPSYKKESGDIAMLWNICVPGQVIFYFNQSFYLINETVEGVLTTKLLFSGFNAPEQNISAAYYDEETGNLYLGSSTKGFFVLCVKQFRSLTNPSGENIFYGQATYKENGIITMGGSLFDLSGSRMTVENANLQERSDYVSLFADAQGYKWTKWKHWLYKLDPSTLRILARWEMPDDISILHKGMKGEVWLGVGKVGIFVLHHEEQPVFMKPCLLYPEIIHNIRQTATDTLFFSTDKGLYCLKISSGKVDTIRGMENKQIRSIFSSSPGEVWITTYGDGFFLYKNKKLTQFPLDRKNYLAASHYIVEDTKGFFWIPTNKGLFQVAKADLLEYAQGNLNDLYFHHYDKSQGFNTNEFNGGCEPCAVKLGNGYVSLPSMNGLVVFKPDSLQTILPDKGLFLDKIDLDKQLIEEAYLLKLPRQFEQLNFYMSAPYAGNKNNVQLKYALESKSKSLVWLPVGENGIVSFSTLAPGDYTLLIRKINGFGKNNFTQKKISLHVLSAWYNAWWCYFACFALLVAISWLLSWFRVRYIKKRNKMLEEGIAIKTRELQRQTHIQEKIIQAIGHDIKTPLKYYGILSRKMQEELEKENSTLVASSKILSDSSEQLYHLVENFLKYLKVQMKGESVNTVSFDLKTLADEKVMIFKDIAFENGTVINNLILKGLNLVSDPQLISVILHNLIDNAVKVTRDGSINIEAQESGGRLCISVKDTGPGLSPQLLAWINNRETISEENTGVPAGCGMGLLIIKELVVLLGIRLEAASRPDKGTCISIIC